MPDMPDQEDPDGITWVEFVDGAFTIVDWIDEVNTLTDEDPESDDDESSAPTDPMNGWDLDGEEEDEDDEM